MKIVAVHLRIATKENLHISEYLMEWAGALELPLSSAKQAFETLGLGDGLPAPVTDFGHSSGATPLKSSLGGEALPEEAGSVSQAAATASSLAASSSDVVIPDSPIAFAVSKALAACLRHGHRPRLAVNAAGWAKVEEVRAWPRISETSATSKSTSSALGAMAAGSYTPSRGIHVLKFL